jgi:hypothetical protein
LRTLAVCQRRSLSRHAWSLRIDDTIAREIMDRAEGFLRHIDSAMGEDLIASDVARSL